MMAASANTALQIAAGPAHSGRGPARRGIAGQLDLRVSDAERAEVADQLSRHYGEGRLDQGEFGERLDRTMAAITYRDLTGVLRDLPQLGAAVPSTPRSPRSPRPRRGRGVLRLALLALLVLLVAATIHAVTWALAPAVWIAVLCAVALMAGHTRARRR